MTSMVSTEPECPADDVKLKSQIPTALKKLNTVVIAVSDTKESEYAFDWALEYMLQFGDKRNRKIILLNVISPVTAPGYYMTAASNGEYLAGGAYFLGFNLYNYINR